MNINFLLINVIAIKDATETLILLPYAEISDMLVSISYFDQVFGKIKSETRHVLNFEGIQFRDFVALKLFAGANFRESREI